MQVIRRRALAATLGAALLATTVTVSPATAMFTTSWCRLEPALLAQSSLKGEPPGPMMHSDRLSLLPLSSEMTQALMRSRRACPTSRLVFHSGEMPK